MDINGYNQVNLTSHPASDTDPIFSPDGAKIVFISNRDNGDDVFIMDVGGTRQVRLTNNKFEDMAPSW